MDPLPIFMVLGGALILMSVCCLAFVIAFSHVLSMYERLFPGDTLKPLRWTLRAAGVSAMAYLLRSIVALSYGFGATWVLYIVGDPLLCAVYRCGALGASTCAVHETLLLRHSDEGHVGRQG